MKFLDHSTNYPSEMVKYFLAWNKNIIRIVYHLLRIPYDALAGLFLWIYPHLYKPLGGIHYSPLEKRIVLIEKLFMDVSWIIPWNSAKACFLKNWVVKLYSLGIATTFFWLVRKLNFSTTTILKDYYKFYFMGGISWKRFLSVRLPIKITQKIFPVTEEMCSARPLFFCRLEISKKLASILTNVQFDAEF